MKTIKLACYSVIVSWIMAGNAAAQGSHNFAIGDTSGTDYGYAVQPTDDGNFVIAGKSSSFPPSVDYLYSDGFIAKINPISNAIIWSKQYRLATLQVAVQYDRSDIFWGTKAAENGHFIIAGTSSDTTGLPSLGPVMLKIDGSGNPIWGRYLTSNGFGNQGYTCAYSAADNSYLLGGTILPVGGTQQAEAFIAKFDTDGNTIWIKTYGTTGSQVCRNLLPVTGGWLMIGVTTPQSSSNTDIFVSKVNDNGILQWTKTVGGIYEDRVNGACILANGNVLLTGFASRTASTGSESLLAMTINPTDGSVIWAETFGTTGTTIGNSVAIQTGQTTAAIVGYTNALGMGGNDALSLVLNTADGTVVREETTGSTFADVLVANVLTSSGNSYAVGNTGATDAVQGNDIYIVKTGGTGADCPFNQANLPISTLTWTATSFTMTTNTGVNAKDYPFAVYAQPFVKQDACYNLATDEAETNLQFTIAPNPTTDKFSLSSDEFGSLSVYNNLGQLLFTQKIEVGSNPINIQSLVSGVYTLRLVAKNGSSASKQVVKL